MFRTAEYDIGQGAGARLRALIRLPDSRATEECRKQVMHLFEEISVHMATDGGYLLSGYGPPHADSDRLLLRLDGILDRFRELESGDRRVELLETGMVCESTVHAGSFAKISERFRVVGPDGPYALTDENLIMESGHVFGSGLHPSTRLVVRALEELAEEAVIFPAKALDVGSGSGILSLICAKLGAKKVLGIDICQESVAVGRRNIRHNRLADRVRIANTPLAEISDIYDLVLANLTVSVFSRIVHNILGRLHPGGTLIVSGLQGRQPESFLEIFERRGYAIKATYSHERWRALRVGRV